MKIVLTTTIFFFSSLLFLHAQVRLGGLTGNPRLIQKKSQATGQLVNKNAVYIAAGQKMQICPGEIHPAALSLEPNAQKKLEQFKVINSGKCVEIYAPLVPFEEDIYLKSMFRDGKLREIIRHVVAVQLAQLPFTEEFSYADDVVVYPDENKWLDKDAYVNDHLAYHPPTLGVATLDGTDENGQPYGEAGSSDTLTSTFIDLSPYDPGDDVYFSFTHQPGGFAVAPFEGEDLVLEFKNADQEWNEVLRVKPTYFFPSETPPAFSYEELSLGDQRYLHENFQFRFRNIGPGTGLVGVWHLDYIRIEENFEPSPQFRLLIDDVALGHPPYSIFKNYTAMPLTQFLADVEAALRDTLRVDLFSHTEETEEVDNNRWSVVNILNGDTLAPTNILIDPINIANIQPPPGQYAEIQSPLPPSQISSLRDNMQSKLAGTDEAIVEVTFDLNEAPEADRDGVTENNSASTIQYLSDFFAYDDGSAELQLELSGDFGAAALEFELLEPQVIKGMLLSFVVVNEADSGDVFRYELRSGSLEGNVLVQEDNARVDYPGNDVRFSQFAYYEFPDIEEGVELQPGKYYLVIRSTRGVAVNIGYDRQMDQTNSRHYVFDVTNREWDLASANPFYAQGVIMGRLVTSDFNRTNNEEASDDFLLWSIYPNPVRNELFIEGLENPVPYLVYDSAGSLRLHGDQLKNSLDVKDLSPGSYMLMVKNGPEWQSRKFIILGQ
ncbi:MAG TPA: T9SS type A sorting domain-containing protein [Saprospiraceae bacterium]|nr:T9SS type A sorting domain-containing protein [Saprospiraceae bacterium]